MEEMGFRQGKIAHQRITDGGRLFPTVLLPLHNTMTVKSLVQTIQNNREWIEEELKEAGALLFRGFPLKTAADFNEVVEAFGWEEQPYLGAASRTRVHGRVFTANEAALDQPIKFHHEMVKFEEFPSKLLFFSEIAPPEGGQTAILLSHNVTARMEQKYPELVAKLDKEGIFYFNTFSPEDHPGIVVKGWQTLYQTRDKDEAEKKALEASQTKVTWEGSKMVVRVGPLTSIRTFDGNKKAWFNQIAYWNSETPRMLGDGSLFPQEATECCIQITEEESVEVNWEVGDVLLIDNRLVQHARRPSKPPRRILVAICK
ncbi:hypothetical protein SUGI_1043100 [Cryptomeria japonica]|nr:hypothetical protein SUGI_1043100 [Cryptomeria japonica]